jgi:hypothetical protein
VLIGIQLEPTQPLAGTRGGQASSSRGAGLRRAQAKHPAGRRGRHPPPARRGQDGGTDHLLYDSIVGADRLPTRYMRFKRDAELVALRNITPRTAVITAGCALLALAAVQLLAAEGSLPPGTSAR